MTLNWLNLINKYKIAAKPWQFKIICISKKREKKIVVINKMRQDLLKLKSDDLEEEKKKTDRD